MYSNMWYVLEFFFFNILQQFETLDAISFGEC